MTAYGAVEVQLHSFFALVIEVSGVLHAPAEFPREGSASDTRMGLRFILASLENRNLLSLSGFEP